MRRQVNRSATTEPLSRRTFLGFGLLLAAAPARPTLRLALAVGDGPLTASIRRGAELGLAEATVFSELFGRRVELLERSAASPEETLAAALALFRDERVAAVIGGTDDRAAEALGRAARQAGGLFFNVGAPSNRVRRELCDRRTFHVQASVDMYVGAAGLWLADERGRSRWALVCSDSPFGGEVEQAASAFLAGRAAKLQARERAPAQAEGWAPVLRRLRDAQPDAVLLGLEPADLAGLARRWAEAGLACELAAVTPDPSFALEADAAGPVGAWPLVWHHSLERYSARELNARFRRRFDRPLDGAAWAAWAAVKLLGEAAVRAEATDAPAILEFVEERLAFDGHKGAALGFRSGDHQLGQPMYVWGRREGAASGDTGARGVTAEVSWERLEAVAGAPASCRS